MSEISTKVLFRTKTSLRRHCHLAILTSYTIESHHWIVQNILHDTFRILQQQTVCSFEYNSSTHFSKLPLH